MTDKELKKKLDKLSDRISDNETRMDLNGLKTMSQLTGGRITYDTEKIYKDEKENKTPEDE